MVIVNASWKIKGHIKGDKNHLRTQTIRERIIYKTDK